MTPDAAKFHRELGERLRTVRQVLNLTERDAANAAGVTVKTWRKWEGGGLTRGHRWVASFTTRYDISLDWLYAGKGPMALSEYHELVDELKALPRNIVRAMLYGERPMLRVVK
jgi:transcriptional regulator with XRE-family HTH domain